MQNFNDYFSNHIHLVSLLIKAWFPFVVSLHAVARIGFIAWLGFSTMMLVLVFAAFRCFSLLVLSSSGL